MREMCSVAVGGALEWTLDPNTNIVRLLLGQCGEVRAESWQVQPGNLLIQRLRQKVHIVLVGLRLLPVLQEVQLSKNLIGERAGHDEGWVASSTTKVEQSASGQDDDAVAIRELEAVD